MTRSAAALIGFIGFGFLAVLWPMAALVLLGLIVAGVGCAVAQPFVLRLAVVGLVLLPTSGLLRTSAAETDAMRLAASVETGSIQNRLATTLLLAVGVVLVFRGREQLRQINLIPWLALFLALDYASTLWSQSAALTLRRSTEALFVTVFALGVGGMYYARRPRGDIEILRIICWATSILMALVMAVFVVHGDFHPASPAWRLGHAGVENQVGSVSAVGLIVAWATRKRPDIWENKWILWFNLAVPGLAVLLSKSRETWLGVLAALCMVELLKPYSLKKKVVGALGIGCVIGVFAFIPALNEMWNRGSSEQDLQTASGRTVLWEKAMPTIRNHLLLGHGYGAFWTGDTVLKFSSEWSPTSLHNGYLQTTAEIGLIGLCLIITGIAVSAKNAWRLTNHPQSSEVGLALLALYACFFVSDFFGGVLEAFNYFPVAAILTYSFFVSHRLRLLETTRSNATAQNAFESRESFTAPFGNSIWDAEHPA
jgi:exopolysaccharide production protein ExoQ